MECVIQDLLTQNADLQSCVKAKDKELAQVKQQLREKVTSVNCIMHCVCCD